MGVTMNNSLLAKEIFGRASQYTRNVAQWKDGDGDGLVFDGTPQQRPVPVHARDDDGRFADKARFGNRKERSHRARVSYSHNMPELKEINDYDWESQPTDYGDPEWEIRSEMMERIDEIAAHSLTDAAEGFNQLSPEEQAARRSVVDRIMHMCPIRMKLRILHNLGHVVHHKDSDAVTLAHMKNMRKSEQEIADVMATDRRVGGFWSFSLNNRENGTLHLGTGAELPSGTRTAQSAKAIWAHELGHVLDGKREFAGMEDWHIAWSKELAGGALTDYASTTPVEGFAEYFERMIDDPKDARKSYPLCWQFFKERFAQ